MYEIKFADQDKDFNTLGRKVPYFYELQLEKFKFSHELINTGVQEIDDSATFSSYTIQLNVAAGAGTYQNKEIVYQALDSTEANATVVAVVQEWNKKANTLNVTNIAGEFIPNRNIIGASSNASYVLANFNPLKDSTRDESSDNYIIENQANSIIDFSETNPFGSI